VEFIHTATLVHDDIIDGAETRRGRLTAHSRWGSDITVLLGDYLYIRSMAMALTQDTLDVVRLLCDCTLRMIEGELYQLTKTGDASITEEEHFEIIRRKTAFLFAGCAEIGGMLGTATLAQREALREYGFNLGIAFQIVDDVLDYMADEAALGKPIGGDLREGKVTLPVILLLQRGGPEAAELIHGVIASGQVAPETWRTIKDLLARHGAVDAAFERAVAHAARAKTHLEEAFPASPERDGLMSLADYVLNRDR
jgi:octaprenyl-diphosphate synthase